MNEVKCAHCESTNVTILSSDATREVIVIQCLNCEKTSELGSDQFHVDTDDLPPG